MVQNTATTSVSCWSGYKGVQQWDRIGELGEAGCKQCNGAENGNQRIWGTNSFVGKGMFCLGARTGELVRKDAKTAMVHRMATSSPEFGLRFQGRV